MKQTSDPTVGLDAMEAALRTELDAEEPNLSVLADAANALFNPLQGAIPRSLLRDRAVSFSF